MYTHEFDIVKLEIDYIFENLTISSQKINLSLHTGGRVPNGQVKGKGITVP